MAHRSKGRRTDYQWSGLLPVGIPLANAATSAITVVTVTSPLTLYRTRGEIVASIDGPTNNDKVGLSMGIIVATEEQVATGAGAMPDPAVDLAAEWLWHGFILLQSQAITTTSAGQQYDRRSVDSKAMRRMKPTQSLVFIVRATPLANTPATDLTIAFRTLFGD